MVVHAVRIATLVDERLQKRIRRSQTQRPIRHERTREDRIIPFLPIMARNVFVPKNQPWSSRPRLSQRIFERLFGFRSEPIEGHGRFRNSDTSQAILLNCLQQTLRSMLWNADRRVPS